MFAVLDFETSGRDAKARATEIGIVLLTGDLEIEETFHSVLNPPVEVNQWSLGYARLQRKEIESSPSFIDLWPQISALLSGRIIIAHGADFDLRVLARELSELGETFEFPSLCTLKLVRRLQGAGPESNELGKVCERFGIELKNPHEALQDAVATALLFKHIHEVQSEKAKIRAAVNALEVQIDELAGQVVALPRLKPSTSPQPRTPSASADSEGGSLSEIAREILSNSSVKRDRIVVKTGNLDRGESTLEMELERVGLRLKETPTTKGTAFLVVGKKPGKSKAEKARSYGRPVITEDDAYSLIDLLDEMGGL